jgi:hypothetical protein
LGLAGGVVECWSDGKPQDSSTPTLRWGVQGEGGSTHKIARLGTIGHDWGFVSRGIR